MKYILWGLGLLITVSVSGQFKTPFIYYNKELYNSNTSEIIQDSKGYMWVLQYGALSRFDSRHFKHYTLQDGLPSTMCTGMYVDSRDRVWLFADQVGVSCFDGQRFRNYGEEEGIAHKALRRQSSYIRVFVEDRLGNVYCRYPEQRGVSCISDLGITNFLDGEDVAPTVDFISVGDKVYVSTASKVGYIIEHDEVEEIEIGFSHGQFVENAEGEVYVVNAKGAVARIEGNKVVEVWREQWGGIDWSNYSSQSVFVEDTLFMTANNSLYKVGIKEGKPKFKQLIEGEDYFHHMVVGKDKSVWLSGEYGLVRYKFGNIEHFTHKHGLPDEQVLSLMVDDEGNIWGTTILGTFMYGKVLFDIATTAFSDSQEDFFFAGVTDPKSKATYIISPNTGILKLNKGEYKINNVLGNSGLNPVSICYFNGGFEVGDYRYGVFRYDGKKLGRVSGYEELFMDMQVMSFAVVSDSLYYAATTKGLMRHLEGKFSIIGEDESEIVKTVRRLVIDKHKTLWGTSHKGVFKYDGKKFRILTEEDGLPNYVFTSIACDRENRIWLASEQGLIRIEQEGDALSIRCYDEADGLRDTNIRTIYIDGNNKLFFNPNSRGMGIMDLKTEGIRYFGEEDGFPTNTIFSYIGGADGITYIGTVDGLVRYISEQDVKSDKLARVYVSVEYDSEEGETKTVVLDSLLIANGLVLPYDRNSVKVNWVGIHYQNPNKNRYRYILEGFESHWHEDVTDTSHEYSLSPGKYRFRLYASNSEGDWIEEEVSFSITILQPWYNTIVTRIIYLLILLTGGYFFTKWRIKKIRAARDAAIETKKAIQDSIDYAARIQGSLIPTKEVVDSVVPQNFVIFKPRDVVSGDFYWVTKKANQSVVMVADCTGHGVPGAFVSLIGMSFLRNIVNFSGIIDTTDILEALRLEVKTTLRQTNNENEQHDGMDVALVVIDYERLRLQYSGAYNPLLLVRGGQMYEYKADKQPVGIHIEEGPFHSHEIKLMKGDMLYMYSDGYPSQLGEVGSKKIGSKKFKQLLLEIHQLPLAEQRTILINYLFEFRKGNKISQTDDITVMGIRV